MEQAFFSQRLIFRGSFFHNEFGRQIEYVGLDLVPALLPNLTAAEQHALEEVLVSSGAYELTLNTQAYRALGVETTVEGGIGRNIFLRGGYTYLDAVIQRSFANDDVALLGPIPTYNGVPNGIPIGADSPLEGARPFRRAPHTGFFTASYATRRLTGVFTSAFVSRSDDSDFLGGYDLNGGNSLLLPNRNLDSGYAKLDLGGSFQLLSWLGTVSYTHLDVYKRQGQEFSQGVSAQRGRPHETTGSEPFEAVFGKVAGEGASQETGPRRFQPACVPRGTKEPSCLLPHLCALA